MPGDPAKTATVHAPNHAGHTTGDCSPAWSAEFFDLIRGGLEGGGVSAEILLRDD